MEVKELRGEPQASTRGLTGVQCGRGEGSNAMSQQNLEEEVVIATVYPEVYPSDMPPILARLEPSHEYIRPH